MDISDKYTSNGFDVTNANLARPQDTERLRQNTHYLSGAKPIGYVAAENSVIITEIGYVESMAPQRVVLPPRVASMEWDNRPA